MEDRLQKILSAAGVCSRRPGGNLHTTGPGHSERPARSPGGTGGPGPGPNCPGRRAGGPAGGPQVLMLYKPRGVVTTLSDEKGRPTVADLVRDCGERVWPVGRLDMDSEGLLLLTGDGALTHGLLHPRHQVEKEYLVWVEGFHPGAVEALTRPMTLNGQRLRPARVRLVRPVRGAPCSLW